MFRFYLILFLSIYINVLLAQTKDTVFLKDGSKYIGKVEQKYGSGIVKIIANNKQININISSIQRIGIGYRKELEIQVICNNGDTICGVLLERNINSNLKILTSSFKSIQLFDFEINKIEYKKIPLSKIYNLSLKDQSNIWGIIVNSKKDKSVIVDNIWANQQIVIESTNIIKIDSVSINSSESQKVIKTQKGILYSGDVYNLTVDYFLIRTKKYGDFLLKKDTISQIKDYIEENRNIDKQIISKQISKVNDTHSLLKKLYTKFDLYNFNTVASFGMISSRSFYCLPQIGFNIQYLQFDKIKIFYEIRFGLSTNFKIANYSINLSPIIVSYEILSKFQTEIIPDLHMRYYDVGSKTTLGLLLGGKYIINNNYSYSLRFGYSSGLFIGINGSYKINTKKQ